MPILRYVQSAMCNVQCFAYPRPPLCSLHIAQTIKNMRNTFISVCLAIVSTVGFGQTAQDNKEILDPINTLFKGMNLGDSAMVHSVFVASPTMATVYKNKEGVMSLRQETALHDFLKAVGTPHDEKWAEPIWEPKIQMDGNFAQVWCKYAFYLGKNLSHCGVDAFQLFKGTDGKWRIFHLADTRTKDNCNVPAAIANQFK